MKSIGKDHKTSPFIIIDFETGGLDMAQCAVTEIGAICIDGDTLEEVARYESLIAPYGYRYDEGAIKVTGLTVEKLTIEGKDINEVKKEFLQFLQTCNIHNSKTANKPVLVAHNATFENKCIQHLCKVWNIDISKMVDGDFDIYGNFIINAIDTLKLSRQMFQHNKRIKNFKLADVCMNMGIEVVDGHRAMNDVIPTTALFVAITRHMRSTNNAGEVLTTTNTPDLFFQIDKKIT